VSAPLISIVVATYNSERTLARCLQSVLAQAHPSWELHIVDGASTDRTLEIAREAQARDARVQVISEPDRGIYDAFNKGVRRAKGEWILFLGSDDWLWDAGAIDRALPQLAQAKDQGHLIAYTRIAMVTQEGQTLHIEGQPWRKVANSFRHVMTIPHQGTFQHRKLFEKHGEFDTSYQISGDYEFLLRELKDGAAFFVSEGIFSAMSMGGISSQLGSTLKILDELERARKQNGLRSPSPELAWRRLKVRMRQTLQKVLGDSATRLLMDLYRVLTGKSRIWTRLK
jgi:hypothetical protein